MKTVTRYHNNLNTIPMRQWTPLEQDFFFAILTQIRDQGTDILTFDKADLQEFADFVQTEGGQFKQVMKSLVDKMDGLRYVEETTHRYARMALFQSFDVNWNDDLTDMTLVIQLASQFEYIVNQLNANFTQFELELFTNLRSTYAKTMFRHIKQWRTKGVIGGYPNGEIPKEELFLMLGVPKSMQRPGHFNEKVLKPILEELSPLFEGLKVKPIKARKAGNPIISYRFSWKQEQTGDYIQGKYDHDKKEPQIQKGLPEWTDEYKLKKAGYDTTELTQNEMYKLRKEKGL